MNRRAVAFTPPLPRGIFRADWRGHRCDCSVVPTHHASMAQRSSATLRNPARPFFDIHVDPPTGADLSIVRLLHRNEDSFVTFMRRDRPEHDMRNIAQLRGAK